MVLFYSSELKTWVPLLLSAGNYDGTPWQLGEKHSALVDDCVICRVSHNILDWGVDPWDLRVAPGQYKFIFMYDEDPKKALLGNLQNCNWKQPLEAAQKAHSIMLPLAHSAEDTVVVPPNMRADWLSQGQHSILRLTYNDGAVLDDRLYSVKVRVNGVERYWGPMNGRTDIDLDSWEKITCADYEVRAPYTNEIVDKGVMSGERVELQNYIYRTVTGDPESGLSVPLPKDEAQRRLMETMQLLVVVDGAPVETESTETPYYREWSAVDPLATYSSVELRLMLGDIVMYQQDFRLERGPPADPPDKRNRTKRIQPELLTVKIEDGRTRMDCVQKGDPNTCVSYQIRVGGVVVDRGQTNFGETGYGAITCFLKTLNKIATVEVKFDLHLGTHTVVREHVPV
jgi:hypothetical protein